MTTGSVLEKVRRERLSIDLEAYQDVKQMLADAVAATGDTTTSLTIQALREKLPAIVQKLSRQRAEKAAEFTRKYSPGATTDAARVLNAAIGKGKKK